MEISPRNEELENEFKRIRKELLTFLEVAYSTQPNWQTVRSHVLCLLGRNGLEAVIYKLNKYTNRYGAGHENKSVR